ncbi:hypothetical protein T484DRAFT_1889652 [Baffinella frigidus]|nr:hypothetical protein T484DRAFT_1889652 [Cryptophyta sp. CCMP2293]
MSSEGTGVQGLIDEATLGQHAANLFGLVVVLAVIWFQLYHKIAEWRAGGAGGVKRPAAGEAKAGAKRAQGGGKDD